MALTRLTNLIASRNGRMIYVNPDDFNATDLISNTGNSPTRPFKTLQRALLEVARFSYVAGLNNDKYDQFTIMLSPGDYIIDNRPGLATAASCPELSDQSNFNILDPNNDLYKFNSTEGGLVVPRGTSIVGMDLRKTRVRPRYVPQPDDAALNPTSIFKVTGACYFWQFSLFDALQLGDTSGLGGVYRQPTSSTLVNPDFSHHKVTCFTYADVNDLNLFYEKAAKAFANIPDTTGELFSRVQENRIVGPLQQAGQKSVGTLNVVGSTATFTSIGNHELFVGQQVTIDNITGTYSALNDTYYIADTPNDTTFVITSTSFLSLPSGTASPSDLTNAIVKAEIDTVDSASPYIFNCSLRSTYGLCGLWADGSKVTGFKSMVVAQFTGVSLQKDDNAFIKFTETTNPPSFVLNGAAVDASSLHQDASGYVFYRETWRHYHIRVSNNAFIQSVSVFAVGYAEQHLIESGGDYSITNSNSNFGTNALIADGFRPDAFALDKKGYISHIVPPQSLAGVESEVPYYPFDVPKSIDTVPANSAGTKLYLLDQINPDSTPAFSINQQKVGGKNTDRIFVKLANPVGGALTEYSAIINPNGIEERVISTVDPVSGSPTDNTFTTTTTNDFATGTPIRIYSSTGYLPLGMESNKLYYAVRITSTTFKISPTEEDARAAAGGSATSVVNIRSAIPLGATLTVKAYVSDTNPNLPAFDIAVDPSDTPTGNSFSTGTYNHGFSTGDPVFIQRRRDNTGTPVSGTLPLVQSGGTTSPLNLAQIYYVRVVNNTVFQIATTQANATAGNIVLLDSTGDANLLRVYRDVIKSPLRFDPSYVTSTTTVKGWYLSVNAIGNTIHPILTSSLAGNIYTNPTVTNTQNSYLKRVPDNRRNADRTYRLRYVIPRTDTNSRPPILGYVIKRKTDSADAIIPHEISTNSSGITSTTNDFSRVYYIYKIDTILPHIPNEQDGVYYLTVLLADVAPKGSQFGTVTNTFAYLKYSQDVSKIYPELEKDNPVSDPSASISVADNLIQGLVYQDDNKKSVTKEAIQTFISETGYTPTLTSLTGLATSGQENRLIPLAAATTAVFVGSISGSTLTVSSTTSGSVQVGQLITGTGVSSNTIIIAAGGSPGTYTLSNSQTVSSTIMQGVAAVQVELRRTSQIRAGNQTFEYTGFNSGNYSTGFPSKQIKVLNDKEVLYSQAQRRRAGVVFYSGLNAYGDLYVGNQKINSVTGEVEILDQPILTVAGSTARTTQDYVPYVSGTQNVQIDGNLVIQGNSTTGTPRVRESSFNSRTDFNAGIVVQAANVSGIETNRALLTEDLVLRPKIGTPLLAPIDGNIKQIVLNKDGNSIPIPGIEGTFRGDMYYKKTITPSTRHQAYIYTGQTVNAGWAQAGLIGVGHLTSIEESSAAVIGAIATTPEFYETIGKFGINKTNPAASLHVGTGDAIIDNNLTVLTNATVSGNTTIRGILDVTGNTNLRANLTASGNTTLGGTLGVTGNTILSSDLAVNGCDITTTCVNFNLLNQPTTVNAFTSATRTNIGASTGQTVINNDLSVVGNLFINGTTTTIESITTTVKDPVISLGASYLSTISGVASTISGVTIPVSGVTPADPKDRGIELNYYTSASAASLVHTVQDNYLIPAETEGPKRGFIGWDTSLRKYVALKNATNVNDVFTGTDAELQLGSINLTNADYAINLSVEPFSTGGITWDHTNKTYVRNVIATGRIDNGTPGNDGNILTITSVTSGVIKVGNRVTADGLFGGTYITNQLTGVEGGVGTYTIASVDVGNGTVRPPFQLTSREMYFNSPSANWNMESFIRQYSLPIGAIVLWSGSIANIPRGWCLCDGVSRVDRVGNTATPPDLRNRFIVGAGDTYNPNNTGGNSSQNITTGDNSVTPTASSAVSGNISDHELNRSQIPQHKHAIDHYHTITDPGHSHTFSYSTNNEGVDNGGASVLDGISFGSGTGVTTASSTIGITQTNDLAATYGATSAQRYSGFGGARDLASSTGAPGEFWNGLGPSGSNSDRGAGHSHGHSLSVNTTLNNTTHTHSFTINMLPPYFALAYIFKL